jgi:hypothetical protein
VTNGGGLWNPAEQEEAGQLVTKTLASPLMERARHAAERFAEAPFSLSLSGRLIEGVIDFAFIEIGSGSSWTSRQIERQQQNVQHGDRPITLSCASTR